MTNLLVMKEHLKNFYGKYEVYITPVMKFLLALVSLFTINRSIGFMYRLMNPAIVLVAALLCSFLPLNIILLFSAAFIILHLYALSLECAVVVFALFLLMFLLYFRFSPRDAVAVLLTPLCFVLRVPYVMPLAMGFVGTPMSAVSVGCGVIVYYVLDYVKVNQAALANLETDSRVQKFQYVIDSIMGNKTMMVMAAAFAVTVVIVYLIRRMSVNYAWKIAMVIGAITNLIVILIGDMMMDINISIAGTIIGTVLSVLLILVLEFFVFSVDYSRTEYVQFEDDEYYYYVKAVPKMMVSAPEKKVKRINSQKKSSSVSSYQKVQPQRTHTKASSRKLDDDFDFR